MTASDGQLKTWLIFPIAVAAIGWYAVTASQWHVATLLGLPAAADDALLPLTAVLVFYPTIALLERWHTHRGDWARPHADVRTDVLHLTISGPLSSVVFNSLFRGLFVALGSAIAARLGWSLWPAQWPAPLQLVLALLLAELGHYWFHRLGHETAWLWRLHATHHSAKRLYWLNATRFHPLDIFGFIVVQTIPLLLLGANHRALLMYGLFSATYGQLQHGNIGIRTAKPVDWIFSTPALHRWHHSTDTREGNSNYGASLSFWDLLFGTFFRPEGRSFRGDVGIAAMPDFPTGYVEQLLSPFRWSGSPYQPGIYRGAKDQPSQPRPDESS
jgi:sterol desaturase/sphingolipid hydroxylase (fatty acid hydroxylase superfamily)